MKYTYEIAIKIEGINKIENLFNVFSVGLGNWSRSDVYAYEGQYWVNYTIVCSENVIISITNLMDELMYH